MPLIEFWVSALILPFIGAGGAYASYKLLEWRNGLIERREDVYGNHAKKIGYDVDEIFAMGLIWAMVGAREDEAREAAKRWVQGE